MIEPEPRVQGQGISPDCGFASRPATKGQSATLLSPVTSSSLVPTSTSNESHTRSDELPARSRYPSTSFPLADHQSRQDKLTRDALFTRAPPNNRDKRIQQRSATMFAVFLCPARNTLFLTTVKGLCNTLMKVNTVDDVKYVQVQCSVDGQSQTKNKYCKKKTCKEKQNHGIKNKTVNKTTQNPLCKKKKTELLANKQAKKQEQNAVQKKSLQNKTKNKSHFRKTNKTVCKKEIQNPLHKKKIATKCKKKKKPLAIKHNTCKNQQHLQKKQTLPFFLHKKTTTSCNFYKTKQLAKKQKQNKTSSRQKHPCKKKKKTL